MGLLLPQLQFLLLALPFLMYVAFRRTALPLITAAIVGAPAWVGIPLDLGALTKIPLTLAWQYSQSVPVLQALVLSGYAPGYTDAFWWMRVSVALVATLGLVGLVMLIVRQPRWLLLLVAVSVLLVVVGGTRTFAAPLLDWVFLRIRWSGVFRELYDLLAFLAIAYTFCAAAAAERIRAVSWIFAAASAPLVATWVTTPPFGYWVNAAVIPHVRVSGDPDFRRALMPPFQPLSFSGFGSGADPDVPVQERTDTQVLNEYLASYPVSAALAQYSRLHDDGGLAALGVDTVIERPWLAPALPLPPDSSTNRRSESVTAPRKERIVAVRNPVPLFGIGPVPRVESFTSNLSANAFLSDRTSLQIHEISAPAVVADPRQGWTVSDLAAVMYPETAQGIGGVATSSSAPVDIATRRLTLVYVGGRLRYDKHLYSSHGTMHWIRSGDGIHEFRCFGVCSLIATTDAAPPVLSSNTTASRAALPFYERLPWIIAVVVPPHEKDVLLRFNTAYDRHWALFGAPTSAHVDIDATMNGWILTPSTKPSAITLVHWVSLLQFVLEVIGMMWVVVLAIFGLRLRTAD